MTAQEFIELSRKLNDLCHRAEQTIDASSLEESKISCELKSRLRSLQEATEPARSI